MQRPNPVIFLLHVNGEESFLIDPTSLGYHHVKIGQEAKRYIWTTSWKKVRKIV